MKKSIADLEFKRFKTLEIREDVRKAYDKTQHRLDILKAQMKSEEEKGNKEQAGHIELEVVQVEKEAERYKSQLKAMDLEVTGSKQTNEYPDGYVGINDTLESLRELEKMLHVYVTRELDA